MRPQRAWGCVFSVVDIILFSSSPAFLVESQCLLPEAVNESANFPCIFASTRFIKLLMFANKEMINIVSFNWHSSNYLLKTVLLTNIIIFKNIKEN